MPLNTLFILARIWHGYTNKENALAYEHLLREEVFPGIGRVSGYKGAQLLKREHEGETEFITITYFDNLEAVKQFADDDYTIAAVPPHAKLLFHRYDQRSSHYELVDMIMSEVFNQFK